jgi:predicted TIM-barrel fold metal-dependent hydrolase
MLELGADKIMFAVDYPIDDNATAVEFLKSSPISDADRHKIAHANAELLFGI